MQPGLKKDVCNHFVIDGIIGSVCDHSVHLNDVICIGRSNSIQSTIFHSCNAIFRLISGTNYNFDIFLTFNLSQLIRSSSMVAGCPFRLSEKVFKLFVPFRDYSTKSPHSIHSNQLLRAQSRLQFTFVITWNNLFLYSFRFEASIIGLRLNRTFYRNEFSSRTERRDIITHSQWVSLIAFYALVHFPSSTSNRIDFFSIVLCSTHNGTWNWNWIRKLDAEKKNQHFNLPFKNFNCISFEILRPNDATKWSTFKMICMCRLISCYCISKFNGIKNGKTFLITIQEKGNPSKVPFSKWVHENQWHVVDRKSYENERVALNSVRSFDLELKERETLYEDRFSKHTRKLLRFQFTQFFHWNVWWLLWNCNFNVAPLDT